MEHESPNPITVRIPDNFYQYGTPYLTDFLGEPNEGLAYVPGGEEAAELEANFGPGHVAVSLLSPYVLGGDFGYSADQLELVRVDIDKREVTVRVKS